MHFVACPMHNRHATNNRSRECYSSSGESMRLILSLSLSLHIYIYSLRMDGVLTGVQRLVLFSRLLSNHLRLPPQSAAEAPWIDIAGRRTTAPHRAPAHPQVLVLNQRLPVMILHRRILHLDTKMTCSKQVSGLICVKFSWKRTGQRVPSIRQSNVTTIWSAIMWQILLLS